MSDFLDRPVFPFRLERSQPLSSTMDYDARAQEIGQVGEGTDAFQAYVNRTVDFSCLLDGEVALQAFEDFLDGLGGGLRGFWVGSDERDFVITAGTSNTVFRIEACGLADAIGHWPGRFLLFRLPDGSTKIGEVDTVEADGGEEVVTLAEALDAVPDASWGVEVLRYVRLSADAEFKYQDTRFARITLHVVEIPLETERPGDATVSRPAYLFEFRIKREFVTWAYRVTSYPAALTVDGKTYAPAPITFGKLTQSTQGDQDSAELTLENWENNPFGNWLPRNIGPIVSCAISEVQLNDDGEPDGAAIVLFRGAARDVEHEGERLTASLVKLVALAPWQVPGAEMGSRCPLKLYDPRTCRADRLANQFEGELTAIAADGSYADFECADLDGKAAALFLPEGEFETGERPLSEVRSIRDAELLTATKFRFYFNYPLISAQANDDAKAWSACDHLTHCGPRFNNDINFGGERFKPASNPSLGVFPPTSNNAKK